MLHGRQFIISRSPFEKEGWDNLELWDGYVLSYHRDLRVYIECEKKVLLLGTAWQVLPGRKAPWEELKAADAAELTKENIYRMEESWCGRYLLIAGDIVYTDACALLNVYYSEYGFSSSCAILREAMGLPKVRFEGEGDLNFMPSPGTQYKEISKLLPSQIYNFKENTVYLRPLYFSHTGEFGDENAVKRQFSDVFANSLRTLIGMFPDHRVLLSITGGKDSRTVLAMAKYSGIPFECYTMEYDDIPEDDVTIPVKLCEAIGIKHSYIKRDKTRYDAALEKEYDEHTLNLANDADRLQYAYGQYKELTNGYDKTLLIRGSVWELAIEVYQNFLGVEKPLDKKTIFAQYGIKKGSVIGNSMESFISWVNENPLDNVSPGDRFTWEFREGDWLPAIEQGFDLMDNVYSFQPINCRYLISMLYTFTLEDRMGKNHQKKLIAFACPEIADIPYEGKLKSARRTPLYWKRQFKKLFRRLSAFGIIDTIKMYLKLIKDSHD
ncbi:MAG: hypothetical protein Q4E57_03315 [Eubacteriales bacterium]|nr:hypothetical protein [Eubacteriales bacterium]